MIALFGNRGTACTPAQSVAIVCSTTRAWSGKSGTTPWMTMSVARPKIVYHQVWANTMSSRFGNPSSLATSKKSCTKRSNNGLPMSSMYCPARTPLRFSGPKKTLRNCCGWAMQN